MGIKTGLVPFGGSEEKGNQSEICFFAGEGRSLSVRAGVGLFLGFSLSPSAGSLGSGVTGQELASSLGNLPMGRLLLIRARIALAHQLPTPQHV